MKTKQFFFNLLLISLLGSIGKSTIQNENEISTIEDTEPFQSITYQNFWIRFFQVATWTYQYFNGEWITINEYFKVTHNYPEENKCKTTLNITTLQTAKYRLIFTINDEAEDYMDNSIQNFYELKYREYTIKFDWNDIKSLPVNITYNVIDGIFTFTIEMQLIKNITFLIDPITVTDTSRNYATRYMNQRKTFRNPRGLQWYYVMLYYHNTTWTTYELRIYRSEDGITWNDYQTIKIYSGSSDYESSSLWIYDNSTMLIIYFTYTHTNGNLYYRRATITDDNSILTFETEQTLITGSAFYKTTKPVITLANDGYIWISYTIYDITLITQLYVDGFDNTLIEWTEVGSSPYLDVLDYPTNYIHTVSTDREGDFSFQNTTAHSPQVLLYIYARGDGDDPLNVTLYNGEGWQTVGFPAPQPTWGWNIIDVSAWLSTLEKVNNCKMRLQKDIIKKSGTIYVDTAYLRIASPYSVKVIASTTVYNPTSTQWSSEYKIENIGSYEGMTHIIPIGQTHDTIMFWKYIQNGTTNWKRAGIELSWNGATFTDGTKNTGYYSNTNPDSSTLYAVCDSENLIHLLHTHSQTQYITYWYIGIGFLETLGTSLVIQNVASISIDLTALPNVIWFFTHKSTGVYPDINRTIEIYEIQLNHDFQHNASILDNTEGYELWHFTSSYRDYVNSIQLAYSRAFYNDVRFYEHILRITAITDSIIPELIFLSIMIGLFIGFPCAIVLWRMIK